MGKMFTSRRKKEHRFMEDKEKLAFAEICPSYGLPASFYEMGAIDDLGSYFVLKALADGKAFFSNLEEDEEIIAVPYEEGLEMMIREAEREQKELTLKSDVLGIFDKSKGRDEARRELRNRINCLEEAKLVFNPNMLSVVTEMNMTEAGYRVGCKIIGHEYEFVSYRPETHPDRPYILEHLGKNMEEPKRFRAVSFNTLVSAIQRKALELNKEEDYEEGHRLKEIAMNMIPADDNIEVVNLDKKICLENESVFVAPEKSESSVFSAAGNGQLSFF